MKLGINTYTFMWSIGFQGANPAYPDKAARPENPLTAMGLLEIAHNFGLSLVQTGPNLPVEKLPEVELEAFIAKAGEWGITLELGTRGVDAAHLEKMVPLAKRMGAKLVRTLPEIGGKYVTDARLLPAEVCKSVPLLEKEGISLGIENGRIPCQEFRTALDEIGSSKVGVVLDMVNSIAVPEGWKQVTEVLAPYTKCLHFKDFTIRREWHMMGFILEGAPAGKGQLDAGWLLTILKASPYDFNVIVELWPPEQAKLADTIALEHAWAAESIPYLRNFIKE
jgi:sugar phosphate isomerase/epimerase